MNGARAAGEGDLADFDKFKFKSHLESFHPVLILFLSNFWSSREGHQKDFALEGSIEKYTGKYEESSFM